MKNSWLREQMTLAEARQHFSNLLKWDPEMRMLGEFNQWVAEHFQTGDELWWYNMGEFGIAIVRGDEVAYLFPVGCD